MLAINNKFKKCNKKNKDKCFSDKLRYHLIDARILEDLPINVILELFLSDYGYIHDDILNKSDKYYNILLYTSGKDRNYKYKKLYLDYIDDLIGVYRRTKGEILPFNIYFNKNKIDEYYENYFKLIDKMFSKMDDLFDKDFFYECLFESYIDLNFSLHEVIIDINMDVYMLLRYLHTYDENKINRVSKECRLNYHKNSIMHAGSDHSIVCSKFFENYFNVTPKIFKYNKYYNCIKLDEYFDFI